jgi:O-antigen/teichoic acid export membrane protein
MAGTLAAAVMKLASLAAGFASQLVLVRLLGVDAYGDFVYALVWCLALAPVAALGIQDSAIRFVPEYRIAGASGRLRGYLRFGRALSLGCPLLVAGAALLATELGRSRIGDDLVSVFRVAWWALPLVVHLAFQQSVLRGGKRVGWALFPSEVLRPTLTALLAWLAIDALGRPPGAPLAMLAVLASFAVAVGVSHRAATRLVGEGGAAGRAEYRPREWLGVGLHLAGISLLLLAVERIDVLLLGVWRDTETVAVYVTASQFAASLAMAMNMSNMITAPLIAEHFKAGSLTELQRVLTLSARATFGVALAAFAALAAAGKALLALFDPSFVAGYPALMILAFAQLVRVVTGPAGFLLTLTGRHRTAAGITVIGAVACVALNLLLIPGYGPLGAATAVAISSVLWKATEALYVRRTLGLNPSIL